MRLGDEVVNHARRLRAGAKSGFTLVEALVAFGIGTLILAGAMSFIYFSAIAASGISIQSVVSQQAGNTLELIESRVRLATSVSNDVTGNVLTLGFDDNYTNDSSGDGIPWNDRDHYERFQFLGVNSTNSTACASNSLVYFTNINSSASRTLIKAGVRNLPGYNIFSITNQIIAIIRFGIVDSYVRDGYQAIDLNATAVSLNRKYSTNVLSIISN